MTNKELLEVIAAEEAGKRIHRQRKHHPDEWEVKPAGDNWNTEVFNYCTAPEPEKKEGKWVRKEIVKKTGIATEYICGMLPIDALPRIPGFGGIEYVDPWDKGSKPYISTGAVLFSELGRLYKSLGSIDAVELRPGIPVAAWFWEEE